MKENGSVLSLFDDHALRSHLTKLFSGQNDIGFSGKFFRFGIIDHKKTDFLNQGKQGFPLSLNP